ncbi:MAG: MotA/TolQ/ExbB proton channel family protein [Planctomycetaceae bacterium]|nr:Chemotaxis protein PomA [Planctomycetota bacterium]MCQ3948690.1 hypothetical protein [Planctomycetota bacterium]NUO16060.1 MotA/TolQ/ExbB proton channel family protein [Planctomycetaceae bacterium]GIK51707.1 MAG: motility protein A [Planctomycetota bacterium]HRJ79755.1 MotA/TolQ/ExbB proton channel family protein [Planctomycetota bacterium]
MDLATLFGLVFGTVCIVVSILIGGGWAPAAVMDFVDAPSIFIVVGGTLAALAVAHPISDIKRLVPLFMRSIKSPSNNTFELIEKIVHYSDTARRNGLLSIEHAMEPGDDPFLRRGLRYAVDGMDREQIEASMEAELESMGSRHSGGKRVFDTIAGMGPAFGMLGTLIGLVAMLKNMSDPKAIGPNMAIALITTFYGACIANLVFAPAATKLSIRHEEEELNKRIIIQGVLGIQAGENPRALKSRLLVFLAPQLRGSEEEA